MGLNVLVHENKFLINNINPVDMIDNNSVNDKSQIFRYKSVFIYLFKIFVLNNSKFFLFLVI